MIMLWDSSFVTWTAGLQVGGNSKLDIIIMAAQQKRINLSIHQPHSQLCFQLEAHSNQI
jgi:hypothetical protein